MILERFNIILPSKVRVRAKIYFVVREPLNLILSGFDREALWKSVRDNHLSYYDGRVGIREWKSPKKLGYLTNSLAFSKFLNLSFPYLKTQQLSENEFLLKDVKFDGEFYVKFFFNSFPIKDDIYPPDAPMNSILLGSLNYFFGNEIKMEIYIPPFASEKYGFEDTNRFSKMTLEEKINLTEHLFERVWIANLLNQAVEEYRFYLGRVSDIDKELERRFCQVGKELFRRVKEEEGYKDFTEQIEKEYGEFIPFRIWFESLTLSNQTILYPKIDLYPFKKNIGKGKTILNETDAKGYVSEILSRLDKAGKEYLLSYLFALKGMDLELIFPQRMKQERRRKKAKRKLIF
jgi:hypothetical protein